MYSNFITPPDFVADELPTVLIVDADWNDVETIAMFCKATPHQFNVYLYTDIMLDEEWLNKAISLAHAIIINTQESACTKIKNQLLKDPRTWYYGPQKFLANSNKISSPLEFFSKYNDRTVQSR